MSYTMCMCGDVNRRTCKQQKKKKKVHEISQREHIVSCTVCVEMSITRGLLTELLIF